MNPFALELHDSDVVQVELSATFDILKVVIFAPYAEDGGAFYELSFEAILRLEYETGLIGEPYFPLGLVGLYLLEDGEREWFKERMQILAAHECPLKSEKGFKEVYHVLLETATVYRGSGRKGDRPGISVVCRHVRAREVTEFWRGRFHRKSTSIKGSPLDDISSN